jgi:polysaccharide export outer membrane protein
MKAIFAVLLLLVFSVGSVFAADQYVIKSGDTLDVVVAGDPGMSKKTVVRPDGKIAIALIGDVKASGLTPQQLSANLQKALLKIPSPNTMQ